MKSRAGFGYLTPDPHFWKHHIEETCTAIPSHLITPFHDHLNGVNKHIQFTLQIKEDKSLKGENQKCKWRHQYFSGCRACVATSTQNGLVSIRSTGLQPALLFNMYAGAVSLIFFVDITMWSSFNHTHPQNKRMSACSVSSLFYPVPSNSLA